MRENNVSETEFRDEITVRSCICWLRVSDVSRMLTAKRKTGVSKPQQTRK
jgi:hypothetical protein